MSMHALVHRTLPLLLAGSVIFARPSTVALAQPGRPAAPAKQKTIRQELPPEAAAKWDSALVLFNAQNWDGARAEFLKTYELSKNPRVLFNVAVCEKNRKKYARAIEILKQELSEGAGKLSAEEETRIKETIAGLESFVFSVTVNVSEPGAKIFMDGDEVGVSPLSSTVGVETGEHRFLAQKPGFVDASKSVIFSGKEDAQKPIELKLEAITRTTPVTVNVVGAPNAIIKVDGRESGPSPFGGRLIVRPEPYTFEAEAPGFVTTKQSVLVKEGEPLSLTLSLSREQRKGKLVVTTRPEGATILIDGKVVGSTRFEGPVDAGSHQISARKAGFYTFHLDVDVPKGGVRPVTAVLNEDRNTSFVPWLVGTIVVIGVGVGAAAVLFSPKDQDPFRGTLPPYIVEHQ